MKKIVSILSIFATTAAIASSVQSDNTFGVMKLNIGSEVGQTIIGVPWENVGGGDIDVNKIMLTNNLTNGDKLYYFNTNSVKFQVWELTSTGWEHQTVVPEEKINQLESASESQTIPRGAALVIERNAAVTSGEVYLYGQYVASTGTSTISAATAESDVYSLIAPCGTGSVDLNSNSLGWSSKAAAGDTISYGKQTYSWDSANNRWHYETEGTGGSIHIEGSGGNVFTPPVDHYTDITIPAGQGVWYKRAKGQTTPFTIEW